MPRPLPGDPVRSSGIVPNAENTQRNRDGASARRADAAVRRQEDARRPATIRRTRGRDRPCPVSPSRRLRSPRLESSGLAWASACPGAFAADRCFRVDASVFAIEPHALAWDETQSAGSAPNSRLYC